MKACREFYFDSSHYLPGYKGNCENVHGHTYRLEITVEGKPGADGMVMDFNEIKSVVQTRVLGRLDHVNLNELMENPTAENIARWIFNELKDHLPLCSVRLWEGKGKWVEVSAEDLA